MATVLLPSVDSWVPDWHALDESYGLQVDRPGLTGDIGEVSICRMLNAVTRDLLVPYEIREDYAGTWCNDFLTPELFASLLTGRGATAMAIQVPYGRDWFLTVTKALYIGQPIAALGSWGPYYFPQWVVIQQWSFEFWRFLQPYTDVEYAVSPTSPGFDGRDPFTQTDGWLVKTRKCAYRSFDPRERLAPHNCLTVRPEWTVLSGEWTDPYGGFDGPEP